MTGNQIPQSNVQGVVKVFAVTCMLGVVGLVGACGGSAGESDDAAPAAALSDASGDGREEPSADPASETAVGRCVSVYSAETLKERAFAFDGTVVDLGSESDPRAPDEDVVTGHVQFEVHEWFAGGTGEAVTVWMQRPVEEGDRLLVAGEPRWGGAPLDDAIAWECGFTDGYSDARSQEWSAAFANGDTASHSPSDAAGGVRAAESDYPPELMEACEPGAREWDGVPIAAFQDPANDELVVCWADGHIPKSPPPGANGEPQASFDRVVFTATMDGDVAEMKRAGYREDMPVASP